MSDLDKALADIITIRSQIAAGTAFRGYGPAAVAATGGVALLTAVLQYVLLTDPTDHPLTFLVGWALAAAVSQANWRFALGGHDNYVWSAAFSPDGSRIVTARGHDK